jgi:hypothetical protein
MGYTPIYLRELISLKSLEDYKLHFARWNGNIEPLDGWTLDRTSWIKWQEYWPGKNDFNRPYIFSLMNFYTEPGTWMFGGIFEVIARHSNRYEVRLCDIASSFVGRLKIRYPYTDRATRVNFEKHFHQMEVGELLPKPFEGQAFPGYTCLDLSFSELEVIVRNRRSDWKQALELAKGIYLITDQSTGRRYVGSAYGDSGIWSRWSAYIESGHGGNVELKKLVPKSNLSYCREHFRIALLEHHTITVSDDTILARETFWKRVLLSRGSAGLNRN